MAFGTAFVLSVPETVDAQISSPPRALLGFQNSAAFGLSYGVQNDRDATFWGWSAEYSRLLGGHWSAAISLTWDRESETAKPNVDTFNLVGTISYALTKRLSITTGLGKGFADTDNPDGSMRFSNGDLGTGIALGFSTPGFKHFTRDAIGISVAYEYNITQKETMFSFDISFGWSF